jgi:hypothetical protein
MRHRYSWAARSRFEPPAYASWLNSSMRLIRQLAIPNYISNSPMIFGSEDKEARAIGKIHFVFFTGFISKRFSDIHNA